MEAQLKPKLREVATAFRTSLIMMPDLSAAQETLDGVHALISAVQNELDSVYYRHLHDEIDATFWEQVFPSLELLKVECLNLDTLRTIVRMMIKKAESIEIDLEAHSQIGSVLYHAWVATLMAAAAEEQVYGQILAHFESRV